MVCASNKQPYPDVHVQSILLPYINLMSFIKILYYIHMPDIIFLVLSSRVQAYDFTLCDMSCDSSHMPLHHHIIKRKEKEILNQEKQIKAKKNVSVQVYHNIRYVKIYIYDTQVKKCFSLRLSYYRVYLIFAIDSLLYLLMKAYSYIVRHGSHLKVKVCGVGLDMYKV